MTPFGGAWARVVDTLLPATFESGSPNARRQAEIGLALSFVWIPLTLVRAVLFWIRGPAIQAGIGFTAVALGCALPLVLNKTGSLRLFSNGVAFLWFASLSSLTY